MKMWRNGHGSGSSPRARGAPFHAFQCVAEPGLIPASAGSTGRSWIYSPAVWAHPRERGEHRRAIAEIAKQWGSSPRARGARPVPGERVGDPGLIPASAGSTLRSSWRLVVSWAHPRERGEHTAAVQASARMLGSSPRARGALHTWSQNAARDGLIPASAGSTPWSRTPMW